MREYSGSSQLSLLFNHTESTLGRILEDRLGKSVCLVLTENSTSMLSVRTSGSVLNVRLHRIFSQAGPDVLEEIVSFLKNRKAVMPRFRAFIRENRESIRSRPANRIRVRTSGKFHDLRLLFDEINADYFDGRIASIITWGTKSPKWAVRKRTLGSFSERSNTIRINPVLDKKSVPRYYVSFVVYHEMLHAAMGIARKGERRSVHSREFRMREKMFREYERAMTWERGAAGEG